MNMDLQAIGLSNIVLGLILITIILVSLSVHEFAHAYVANLFGDPTAKLEGRLTLNPLVHWDRIGTTLLVGLLILRTFGVAVPVFGWGKPVPVDERNFDNPRLYSLQTALAGPMSNLLLALVLAALVRFLTMPEFLNQVAILAIQLNLFLMFFNMLPVPPLDGSRLLRIFLPEQLYFNLATNPLFFIGFIFIAIFFLLDVVIALTDQTATFLLQ